MKLAFRMLPVLLMIGASVLLMSCDEDNGGGSSEEQTQLDKLTDTWTVSSVTLDGTDRTNDFPGLVLTISGTYAVNGTYAFSFAGTRPNPSPWPASGTWKFDANPNSQIIRLDDSQKINYTLGSNNAQLTLEFNYQGSGFAGGRVEVVNGNWQFIFTK